MQIINKLNISAARQYPFTILVVIIQLFVLIKLIATILSSLITQYRHIIYYFKIKYGSYGCVKFNNCYSYIFLGCSLVAGELLQLVFLLHLILTSNLGKIAVIRVLFIKKVKTKNIFPIKVESVIAS